jgi:invasion protein IalB
MEFESCLQIGCVASVGAPDTLIAAMKKGALLKVQFTGPSGKPLQVGITLSGFTAALDGPAEAVNTSDQAPSRPSKGDAPPQ